MIELLELNKNFDDIKAVNHVSLSILDSEVFGLVGTNGAGKSTLLNALLRLFVKEIEEES